MGLTSALHTGRSGLLASQAGVENAGNNLANIATPGYHRRRVSTAAAPGQEIGRGIFMGRGVRLQRIERQVSEALETRLRGAVSDSARSTVQQELLQQLESIQGELSDHDLSTDLTAFFNAWSELANDPQDSASRTLVVEQGVSLTDKVRGLRSELDTTRAQVEAELHSTVAAADDALSRLEAVNREVAQQERGGLPDSPLRDRRDAILTELAEYLDIRTVEQESGGIDVYAGSLPIMVGGHSRGIELRERTVDGELKTQIVIGDDRSPLDISTGRLGALIDFRDGDLTDAVDTLDRFAGGLAYEVNRVHSQGMGLEPLSAVSATVRMDDPALALDDPANRLPFPPGNGSFEVYTIDAAGRRTTSVINIDAGGGGGGGGGTSLNDLAAALDGVDGMSASVDPAGRLQLTAQGTTRGLAFGRDSSGVLAALGVGGFFRGGDSTDLDVSELVIGNPSHVAAAGADGAAGDNSIALAITELRNTPTQSLGGESVTGFWSRQVERLAVRHGGAREQVAADAAVRDNLQAQQQAHSGVNADEEAVDLMSYQRAYQASARFITVVDELMDTLLSIA